MSLTYLAIFLVSAATLLLEITLTRIFSVTQGYHFAFMAVSLALLGFGASGTALAVWPRVMQRDVRAVLAGASVFFAIAAIGGLYVTNRLPFDAYTLLWQGRQLLFLALYYLVLAVPFFFAGAVVGAALASLPGKAGRLYASNLIGSALGCLLSMLVPTLVGASGAVVVVALIGLLAAAVLTSRRTRWTLGAAAVALVVATTAFPAALELSISPYKGISQALLPERAAKVWAEWNAFSLVEVVESPSIHMAPGLSFTYDGEIPPQMAIAFDGDNLSPITDLSPEDAAFTGSLPTSLVYQLSPGSRALLVEPRGGLDVLTALHHGAASVVAVIGNPLVLEAVAGRTGSSAGDVYSNPRVTVAVEGHRSYLRGTDERFDVVQVSLADAFRPVLAGAYSISESYMYTTEAFQEYYRRLAPDGFLSVTRWIQLPPSEGIRTVSVAVRALEREGVERPGSHIAVFRSLQTLTLLVKRSELTDADVKRLRELTGRLQYDLVYYDGIDPSELNRYNVHPAPIYHDAVAEILSRENRADFYRRQSFDVSPVTDDRPFFFHLFRWAQTGEILGNLGKTFQPFGGAGFLIVLGILAVATASALLFIVLPLFLAGSSRGQAGSESHEVGRLWPFLYFTALGLGFLWIEIPLLQRFILYLDQPTYSFAAVLFAILLWSGIGSLLSERVRGHADVAVAAAGGLALVYAFATPAMFDATLGLPLAARLALSVLALGPLGVAMGIPFPRGITLLGESAPRLVPWAWAVNGSVSVVGAILATIMALSFGFTWVMVLAAAAYLLAAATIRLWARAARKAG